MPSKINIFDIDDTLIHAAWKTKLLATKETEYAIIKLQSSGLQRGWPFEQILILIRNYCRDLLQFCFKHFTPLNI